jgi:acetolactate synthase-1/2/3 large subunit
LPFPKEIVIIDPAPIRAVKNSNAKWSLTTADFQLVATALQKVGEKKNWRDYVKICNSTKERIENSARERSGMMFVNAINESWNQENSIFCDMAVSGYWVGVYGSNQRPRRSAYPVGWGTLGFALPAAIGAAQTSPTLVICGDGGLAFALSELATIKQENLPITILLNDDGGYGMLRFDQEVMNHPERGVNLFNPDWELIAKSFGFDFQEVSLSNLAGALKKSALSKNPNLILFRDKLYPPRSTSPRWREVN